MNDEKNSGKEELKDIEIQEGETIGNIPQYLKYLRQKKAVLIEDAAMYLKINTDYLKAFENGDFDSLPEEAYAKIFLKTYTNYLGGDSKLVLAKFNQMLAEKKQKLEKVKENKFSREIPPQLKDLWKKGTQNSHKNWLLSAVILLIVLAGLICSRKGKEKLSEDVSFQEEIIPKELIGSKRKGKNESVKIAGERPVMDKKEDKVILKATALDNVNLELVIDGKITIKEIMKKEETRTWVADKSFVINTDNVGAVDFTFNNERFGVLGELGQPKEGISFPVDKKEQ